jgi:acyl-CoA dehydrogenase
MKELADLLDQILGRPPLHAGDSLGSPVWLALQESQLHRVGLDEALGGAGGSRTEAAEVITRCAESGLSLPLSEAVITAATLCQRAGLPLPPGVVACLISRADARISARRDGDSWRLDGAAPAVAWASVADAVLVLADVSHEQAGVAIVQPAAVTVQPAGNLAGEPRDAVRLDNVRVPPGRLALLPRSAVSDVAVLGALGRTCQLTGAMRSCVTLSIDYARLRRQFGRTIDGYQVIRHALVEMLGELTVTEAATGSAVDLAAGPEPLSEQASLAVLVARVQASRAATRIAAIAHQVHGAIGLTSEHALHHFTTRLWSWRDEEGTEHEWALSLAALASQGGDLWASLTAMA